MCLTTTPAYAEDVETLESNEAIPAETEKAPIPAPKIINEGGAGDLLIAPTRVVFSGRTRSAEIILKNRGTQTTTYRVQLMDLGVTENGEYEPTEQYEHSAAKMIRYSPRQVTLAPGASQKVKLLARKPANLPEGEYRSHLKFQALPNGDAGKDVEATELSDKVSVKLIPIVGISIPVILQQGPVNAAVAIQAKRVKDKAEITITRKGNSSAIGEIIIKAGSEIIANANASVLYPASRKHLSLPLPESAKGKPLTVEFIEPHGDQTKVLATSTM